MGLHHKCAAIRAIEVPPDNQALLAGKEDAVFPLLEQLRTRRSRKTGRSADPGFDDDAPGPCYLCRTVAGAGDHPGPLSYKIAEAALALGYRHSRVGYPAPMHPKLDMWRPCLREQLRRKGEPDPHVLSDSQVAQYARDGFLFPCRCSAPARLRNCAVNWSHGNSTWCSD